MRTAIEVGSGELLDLAHPDPDLVRIPDIAAALSKLCRFTGHVRRFYSVAEHAVLVSRLLEAEGHDLRTQYLGLHHDDTEAYIGDVSTPLKAMLPDYRSIEHRLTQAVEMANGVDVLLWRSTPTAAHRAWSRVHEADQRALEIEAKSLLPSGGAWLDHSVTVPLRLSLRPWGFDPPQAAGIYLQRHRRLAAELGL